MRSCVTAILSSRLRFCHAAASPIRRRHSVRHVATRVSEKEEVRCYVNDEGHLVCDRLEPGDYVVKGAESTEAHKEDAETGVAFCYITESGELVCEGLPTGDYTIERATEEQMKEMLARIELINDDASAPAAKAEEVTEEKYDPETGVRCYVNADGVMVCEKLDPGDYVVKPMPSEKTAPQAQQNEGVTFCYITDDGELICEGMEEGNYRIEKATDDDLSAMIEHVEGITKSTTE